MEDLVILSAREQEYLLRAIESALHVNKRRHFFLWTQGQFQGLLPHEVMVCIQFGSNDEVLHIECLHGVVLDPDTIDLLCNPHDGLALRLAYHCRSEERLPCVVERKDEDETHPLNRLLTEMEMRKLKNAVVHGTERLPGGATFFAIFGLPEIPSPRQAFFMELLLPHLHLALQRLMSNNEGDVALMSQSQARPVVTSREIEILRWVKEGKSNYEIGVILGISALTVKNHVQKIFKKLNVQNRAQAVSRCISLRLLDSRN